MTDFGANIFEEENPKSPPKRPRRRTKSTSKKTPATANTAGVALFADLDALATRAVAAGVLVAWNRLYRALAKERDVHAAVAIAQQTRRIPVGFELLTDDRDTKPAALLAERALEQAALGRTVVLAPDCDAMRALAQTHHSAGHAVELVTVTGDAADADASGRPDKTAQKEDFDAPLRELDGGCWFAP